jgi:hypothetical protein
MRAVHDVDVMTEQGDLIGCEPVAGLRCELDLNGEAIDRISSLGNVFLIEGISAPA